MSAWMRRIGRHPFVVFSLLLWVKLAILRFFLFEKLQITGWLLDLAGIVVLTGLVDMLFRGRGKKAAYWGLNVLLSVVFLAAALYFQHFGSIITYTSILAFKQLLQISSSVKATFHPLDLLFVADLALALLVWLFGRLNGKKQRREYAPASYRGIVFAVFLTGLMLSAYFVKYGSVTSNELVLAEQLGLLGYEVSVAVNGGTDKHHLTLASPEQADATVKSLKLSYGYGEELKKTPALFGSQKGRNLIVVQLEAFQNFPIGLREFGHELTPVLNQLAAESYYFPRVFQQVGQGNTSDAEFMSNTSIYPTGTIPMSTGYGDRSLPSLPKLLEEQGYEADTFHVNEVHFWDRNKLYPALGFTRYFDKPYYNNDQFNAFGASDEELFRVGVEQLTRLKDENKPFYAQFVTVSSHFPFKIPNDRRKMEIPAALEGTQLGDYLLAVNYTDYAVGTLIERLQASGLWENSIFVAYGDHFGLQPEDNDPAWLSQQLGITYHPYITRFNIPLFIHVPGQTEGKRLEQVGGQLDIMPTLANLLGLPLEENGFIHFGRDLLNIQRNAFGMRYYLPSGSFFNDDILYVPGKTFEDGTAVSLDTLSPVPDFSAYRQDYDYIMNLMELSDAYVKMLPKREPG